MTIHSDFVNEIGRELDARTDLASWVNAGA
jgi:hypothetical protein